MRLRVAQQHGGEIDAEHRRYKARLMTVKKEKQLLAEHNLLLERQIRVRLVRLFFFLKGLGF